MRHSCVHSRTVVLSIAALVALVVPASTDAAMTTFGSPLSAPGTKNTATDLGYSGSDVALPGSVFHIPHDGADTALWNNSAAAPASGQVTSVRLEGCAQQPPGAPAPLKQIHFQDLVPLPGGGVTVNVTTQSFEIPVCGQNGASASTITTFTPTNFCVNQGDYIDFNDEGGFVPSSSGPPPYPAGVPYLVIGSVAGSTMSSFIRNNGVGNGATFSSGDSTFHDGFASNGGQELLLQATLATGPDATPLCPGGTAGVHSAGGAGAASQLALLPPIHIGPQTDGVSHSRVAKVAIFCRAPGGCRGVATLTSLSGGVLGSSNFNLRGKRTAHVPIQVTAAVMSMLRKHRAGLPVTLTVIDGAPVTQTITLRIF